MLNASGNIPLTTRLRYVSANNLDDIEEYLYTLGVRVQIYAINFVKNRWYIHFVPPDRIDMDIKSINL